MSIECYETCLTIKALLKNTPKDFLLSTRMILKSAVRRSFSCKWHTEEEEGRRKKRIKFDKARWTAINPNFSLVPCKIVVRWSLCSYLKRWIQLSMVRTYVRVWVENCQLLNGCILALHCIYQLNEVKVPWEMKQNLWHFGRLFCRRHAIHGDGFFQLLTLGHIYITLMDLEKKSWRSFDMMEDCPANWK